MPFYKDSFKALIKPSLLVRYTVLREERRREFKTGERRTYISRFTSRPRDYVTILNCLDAVFFLSYSGSRYLSVTNKSYNYRDIGGVLDCCR